MGYRRRVCGRFVSSSPPEVIADYFDVDTAGEMAPGSQPRFNVAPTTDVFVVYTEGGLRRLDAFHWGLVPSWAKDLSVGNRMINARSETVSEKPAFRNLFRSRRCIVPADGFYEWKAPPPDAPRGTRKQPYFIHRPDGEPYAFAGLWTQWHGRDATGEEVTVRSTTILTGPANEPMAALHDRMPIILAPGSWSEWLDPDQHDTGALQRLLVPAPAELVVFHPVSLDVGNVRNQGEYLTEPLVDQA